MSIDEDAEMVALAGRIRAIKSVIIERADTFGIGLELKKNGRSIRIVCGTGDDEGNYATHVLGTSTGSTMATDDDTVAFVEAFT